MTVTDATVTRVPVHPPGRFRQGSGRLCLDFLRTLRYRNTPEVREELVDEEALAAWVEQCGPFGAGPLPPPSPEELGDARAVREAGYALILAALGPEGPAGLSEAARVRLNSAAGYPPPTPRLAPSGELGWHADHPVLATVALVARDALDLAASPALLPRLRPCASPACGALFLDSSRPGTRRWCSMEPCGNRAKKAGLRARA
ncbi:CGNR zinc finger domain-containing protein [Streptomyces sp. NBC_01190]|uniref:CGNR zinc finger domain-containing protein n=1 Tax=Streptomyces sp. NBC_01190 TaxID=2903767 RepID=UPI003865AD0C|nr:CGNR zinc finger domain-containing protein [Streptomyces sp. NBC_01190]